MRNIFKKTAILILIIGTIYSCSKKNDISETTGGLGMIKAVIEFDEGYDKMHSLRLIVGGVNDTEGYPIFIPVAYLNTGMEYKESDFVEEQFDKTLHSFQTTDNSTHFNYSIGLRSPLQDPFTVKYSVKFYFNGELVHTNNVNESNVTQAIQQQAGWNSTEGFSEFHLIVQ